ncbi:MAG: L,D-transpeptidase [Candidatus Geothermincolia bacterium]
MKTSTGSRAATHPGLALFRNRFTAKVLVACVAALFVLVPAASALAPAAAAGGPQPPAGLDVFKRQEDRGLRITLSWNQQPGAAGYKVYRSEKLSGPFQEIGGASAASWRDYPFFLDDTASPGAKYYYRVSSVDGNWAEGEQSGPVTAKMGKGRRASAGPKSIVVSLADQRAYFLEGGIVVNILRVSTGTSGTPTGNYSITSHSGTVSGCAYWMDWRPNYGMHAWPSYLSAFEENLGVNPCSHGCVRLHPLEAYWPYQWAPDGTPFTVIAGSAGRLPLQGTSCSNGVTRASKTWYFAEGFCDTEFMEFILLFNPGARPTVAVTTYHPEGRAPITEAYQLPGGSRVTIAVNNVSGMPFGVGHGIDIKSEEPIVVQQSEYFNWANRRGGTTTMGAMSPSRTWYFAEGYNGAQFSSFLLLYNPQATEAVCHVTYFVQGGQPYFHDFTMPPQSRSTTLVNALPGLNGQAFSVKVESSKPVVAQRNIYFDWSGFAYGINGGDSVMGVPAASKTWYLAEGCTGHFFDEYVLVMNPTDKLATVNVEFATSVGPRPYQCQVAPYSRGTIAVDSIPGMESIDTGAIITSDTDVVIERAMYLARDSRRGGDVTMGSTESSKDWFFAEGNTAGTFDEYILVMNPGNETATVNYVFHLENGTDVGCNYVVGPKSRITLHVDDFPGLDWTGSAVEIHCDKPVVAEQAHYFCIPR